MPEFVASPITNAGFDPLAVQQNALANAGAQQDLTDRATFRDNAPGLVARDPTATGQAMGANPAAAQAFLNSIPNMDANTRAQASTDIAASGALAGSVLSQPATQRQAAWDAGRQTLIASGHKMVPPEQYPGDGALQTMRGLALTAQQQFELQPPIPTVNPQPYLTSTPGGGYVGPGGAPGSAAGGGGITATPLPAPPGQQGSPGYDTALGRSEGGSNPAAVNAGGYSGQYQFGTGRLTDLGFYQPAAGEDPNGNAWRGTFNIPGYPQVKTQADFLHNVGAQNAVQAASSADIRNQIAQTPGAQNYDPNGLAAVAHLGGVAGMQKFVQTGGQYNPADANGTRLSDYYQRFSSPGGAAQRPVQVADASNTNGMPQTATDATPGGVSGSATAARIQQQRQQGFTIPPSAASNSSKPGVVVPPSGAVSAAPGSYDPASVTNVDTPAAAQGLPGNAPWRLPDGSVHMNAPQPEPVLVPSVGGSGSSNALLLPPQPQAAPSQPPTAAAGLGSSQNVLSGLGTIVPSAPNQLTALGVPSVVRAPNALLPAGQPSAPAPTQVSTPSAVSPAQPSAPPPAQATQQQPAAAPLPFLRDPKTYAMVPVPNQPGYAFAQGPGGQWVAQRIPGAPGKGVKTTIVGGHAISTDEQDGHIVSDVGGMPDASRTTIVPGPQGNIVMQSGHAIGTISYSTQPAQIAAYRRDSDVVTKVAQSSTAAEQDLQQTLEARKLAQGLPTGTGGENRLAIASAIKTFAPDSVYQAVLNSGFIPDSPQGEQLGKILLRGAVTDEQTMGGSGGLGMTEKFQKAYPNLNMQPESIQAILNLKAVNAQAAKDYADNATQYFNGQQDNILHQGGQYQPLSNFNQAWHSQQNAQTYFAAVQAMNGKPYAEWSKGLQGADQDRALSVISRIDPTTSVNGPNGPISVVKGGGQSRQSSAAAPANAAPAVGSVMQGYRFNGGDPGNPASWARVQ